MVASKPGSFGYSEATRQFRLPPPSGQPELTVYGSRATIDTGVETISSETLFDIPFVRQLTSQVVHQDVTINEDVGFQLAKPLPEIGSVHSSLSGGLDYKVYSLSSYGTNIFTDLTYYKNSSGQIVANPPANEESAVPATYPTLDYLPLSLNYSASLQDAFGPATWGLGLSANLWYSSSTLTNQGVELEGEKSLQFITGSAQSTGHWVVLRPSFSQEIDFYTNWTTSIRADGQWSSEPLVSTEQYGAGGVNSVRGYHEGEVFGDTGWHVSLEQQTPAHVVGSVYDGAPLTIRGSVYMDYADVYLLDPPQGRQARTPLWGTGFGFSAATGSHWQAQFLFSWPLLSAGTVSAYQPFFNFALTAQF